MTKSWLDIFRLFLRDKLVRHMVEKRAASPEPESASKKPRLPKRKVALQIGYCGTGYHGMQTNPPHKTIEGDLFTALGKAGAVSEDNADDPKKSSLIRAARTDKGVHAAGNVVSLKMIIEDPEIVAKINSHLPEQIRVWGFTRTNRAFECRKMCSSRIYEYVLPTYTLMPPAPQTQLGKVLAENTDRLAGDDELKAESRDFWAAAEQLLEQVKEEAKNSDGGNDITTEPAPADPAPADEGELVEGVSPEEAVLLRRAHNKARRGYRISAKRLDLFRQALKTYEGVHNFHNFTVGKTFKDPSSTRIMKSLQVSDPFVINDTEWVSVKIHGQSFMLHQIRKMIALAVLATRTHSPVSKVSGLYGEDKLSIPKAPALGLLLERPVYDSYNKRLSQFGHDAISFDKFDSEIDAFKHKFIYDRIYRQEAAENEFQAFFGYCDTYQQRAILNYLLDVEFAQPDEGEPRLSESDNEANNDEAEG